VNPHSAHAALSIALLVRHDDHPAHEDIPSRPNKTRNTAMTKTSAQPRSARAFGKVLARLQHAGFVQRSSNGLLVYPDPLRTFLWELEFDLAEALGEEGYYLAKVTHDGDERYWEIDFGVPAASGFFDMGRFESGFSLNGLLNWMDAQ
jgi:hypothetical protein